MVSYTTGGLSRAGSALVCQAMEAIPLIPQLASQEQAMMDSDWCTTTLPSTPEVSALGL